MRQKPSRVVEADYSGKTFKANLAVSGRLDTHLNLLLLSLVVNSIDRTSTVNKLAQHSGKSLAQKDKEWKRLTKGVNQLS